MQREKAMSFLRCVAVTTASFVLALGSLTAQDKGDPLAEAKGKQQIAIQKAERDVLDAREDIFRAKLSDPDKAIEELKALLEKLDDNTDLPKEKRDSLKARLGKSIGYFQRMQADRKVNGPAEEAKRIEDAKARRATDEKRTEDQKKTTRDAADIIGKRKDAVGEARSIRDEKSEKTVAVMREVDRSSIPEARDYVLPRDWVEKSMRRAKNFKLSAAEEAILKALNEPRSVDFKGTTFGETISYLQKVMGVNIIVDPLAMNQVAITNESPITLNTNKIATRTILKKMLSELNMTYVIKDESIFITSIDRAKEMMTVRTYYVGDL